MPNREPRVFISYRRDDTGPYAGWLHDRLSQQFGRRNVFKDHDSLQAGSDFARTIGQAVAGCDVLVALIGSAWAGPEQSGQWRIWEAGDWVRLELEAAFTHGVRVIPLVLAGIPPFPQGFLPPGLEPLRTRHALRFNYDTFSEDVRKLVEVIESDSQTTFDVGPGGRSVSTRASRFADVERLYQSQIEIEGAIYRYDPFMKASNRRDQLDQLVDALDDDERPANLALANVVDLATESLKSQLRRGIVAVTPRRLVFVQAERRPQYYLPYAQILRADIGMARTSVTFTLPDRNVGVTHFKPFMRAAEFAEYVRERLPR